MRLVALEPLVLQEQQALLALRAPSVQMVELALLVPQELPLTLVQLVVQEPLVQQVLVLQVLRALE